MVRSFGRVAVAMAEAEYWQAGPEGGSEEPVEAEVARRTEALRAALARSEALLQDLDHRAKNNLQALASLAVLKARRVKDGAARGALTNMAERIGAISTAHRLVQPDGDATWFDLRDLVGDVSRDLVEAIKPAGVDVAFDLAPLALAGDKAAPLALLVGEAVIACWGSPGSGAPATQPSQLPPARRYRRPRACVGVLTCS